MKISFNLFLITSGFIAICGCSSTPVLFNVKSEPLQADVFYKASENDSKKPLGKTPLSIPMTEFKKILGSDLKSGQFLTIIIEKPGFTSQSFMLPATQYGTALTNMDVKLKTGAAKEERLAREVLDHLLLAQKLALAQQYERANIEIDKILNDLPDFTPAMSMRAAIFYAQKNIPESLKWYENTLKSDPKDDEAVKMIAKIKGNSGRAPAADPKAKGK